MHESPEVLDRRNFRECLGGTVGLLLAYALFTLAREWQGWSGDWTAVGGLVSGLVGGYVGLAAVGSHYRRMDSSR